jgi:hypothetical protein
VTGPDPIAAFDRTRVALGERYRLERIAASNADRVLFEGYDETLKRRVSIRVNFFRDAAIRAWFLREAEALGQLDHPAVRHVYDAGVAGDVAYRIGTWIDGEGLHEAVRRAEGVDYELLTLRGTGGCGRVNRVRDLHLVREV